MKKLEEKKMKMNEKRGGMERKGKEIKKKDWGKIRLLHWRKKR